MGDINSYLPTTSFRDKPDNRSIYFSTFLQQNNLISVNTLDICTGAKSTFVTYDGRHESLIDHILIPVEMLHYVISCEISVDDALNVSRHRPVFCRLSLPVNCYEEATAQVDGTCSIINWRKVNDENINSYKFALENNVNLLKLSECDLSSFAAVDQAYSSLVYEVKSCAENCFPLKKFKRFLKPYWNKELRDLHHKMKTKRGVWTGAGKPRNPTRRSYIEYKDAKRNFRRCHRHYVEKYLQSQNEEIDRAAEIDSNMFWRMVNARRKASANRAGSEIIFNGKHFNTSAEITTEWGKYFKDLYSPTNNDYFDNSFDTLVSSEMNQIDRVLSDSANPLEYPEISVDEVGSAVKLAHKNKAAGEDGITYECYLWRGISV